MHVDDNVRREALLRILRDKLRQCRNVVLHVELQMEWEWTGLRRSDLELAIADLTARGCWTLTPAPAGPSYHLVVEAVERLLRPPQTVAELSAQVVARAELFRSMQRRRSAHPGHGRRQSDRSTMGAASAPSVA